jgi:hypothetical protein
MCVFVREKEAVCLWVYVCERERESHSCVFVGEKESLCACVCLSVCDTLDRVCVCLCVHVFESVSLEKR